MLSRVFMRKMHDSKLPSVIVTNVSKEIKKIGVNSPMKEDEMPQLKKKNNKRNKLN